MYGINLDLGNTAFFVFEPTKPFLHLPFIFPGDYASTQLPYHITSHNGDKLMGHSNLVAKVSRAMGIISSWLDNFIVAGEPAAFCTTRSNTEA